VIKCCATNRKVAGSIPAGVSGFFIDINSFRSLYGLGVDSASNRNEYQAYFLGVKVAGAVVTKSGNLNFLEPSGPLQACNGTALALHFNNIYYYYYYYYYYYNSHYGSSVTHSLGKALS